MSSNGLYSASERHAAYDAGTIAAVSIHMHNSRHSGLSCVLKHSPLREIKCKKIVTQNLV